MILCVSYMQLKVGSCLLIHSVILSVFIGKLNALILRDINYQCMLIPAISLLVVVTVCLYVCVCVHARMCVCMYVSAFYFSVCFAGAKLFISCIFLGKVKVLGLNFFCRTFCSAGFVGSVQIWLDHGISCFFFPSMLIESFSGYISLGWH